MDYRLYWRILYNIVLAQANMFKTLPLRETQVNDTLSEIWPADVRSSCT